MSMAFDDKKEYREFYLPPRTPGLIDVPQTRYIAVSGSGDPNAPDGAFAHGAAPSGPPPAVTGIRR